LFRAKLYPWPGLKSSGCLVLAMGRNPKLFNLGHGEDQARAMKPRPRLRSSCYLVLARVRNPKLFNLGHG